MLPSDDNDGPLGSLEQYMREVKRISPLTNEEEAELLLSIKCGVGAQQAIDRLIEGYQPMLIGLAKRFVRHCRLMELMDLVQEGNRGLLQALEKYDERKESSFRTFAFSWIRVVMLTAFWQYEGTIRLPLQKVRAMRHMGVVNTRLLSELGHEPTIAETARAMEVSEMGVRELMALQEQQVVSLYAFPTDDEDLTLAEIIPDPTASAFVDDGSLSVEDALRCLPERELLVVRLRYGFQDGQAYTQKEVASLLGVTLSTVVMLDRRAQTHLRRVLEGMAS